MLHCTDMTVLEWQRTRLKWQQEQRQVLQQQQHQHGPQQESYFGDLSSVFQGGGGLGEVVTLSTSLSVKPDPVLVDNGWPDFVGFAPCGRYADNNNNVSGMEFNCANISRTSSYPPLVAEAAAPAADKAKESVLSDNISSGVARESFRKRKVDKVQNNAEVCLFLPFMRVWFHSFA
uniref:Uncharacterized protein n=1 Tax=Rhizophora mucronata TaxID=61149 RepID=A0A2P2LLN2_RHIMU